ncbi:uncharacterized protein DUF2333 [Desulfobotulus alkaliphilus]|uniref:Uncharacterized protein DUF2333 n=1 Tax=Desulfobotulus alkaliphilus TaxID=622671 RepID=A0A562R554_9BACT|nr:DUF2333 family protein [Desulfobotulus alkaliphilus]TWI64178.1 uncharacterized protein DUF2333 [Desulfobotulus alkaliphilus]
MHQDRETKEPEGENQSLEKTISRQQGLAIFFTLFGLWLIISLFSLMGSNQTDFEKEMSLAETPSMLDTEGGRIIRPGNEGHVTASPVRESEPSPAASPDEGDADNRAELQPPSIDINGEGLGSVVGWAFVEAAMQPMRYELYDRFWGWRPNDLIRPTDNVNNFQLGTLEVTRRTAVRLAEDISRTGSAASIDPHLEQAMNGFMIRPTKFWFPSAESQYKASLRAMAKYQENLVKGDARFYNRSDNLIPLLIAYKNLLGSCNENLIKTHESDGRPVSFFKADDYLYYSKGVASAMATILEAVEHDFYPMLQKRDGLDSLRKAIYYCRKADEIDPIIVLNSSLNSLLANHRANLAAHISLARFHIGVLITTIST